ncbi:hypothetical protein JCM10213_002901 [Rhodosporidiobolus nylandii]
MSHNDPPPAYSAQQDASHLGVPSRHRRTDSSASNSDWTASSDGHGDDGVIPAEARRDIIDEQRPLPENWRREWDPKSEHFFYVDTKASPPRSIWCHPLDPEYLAAHPQDAKELSSEYAPPSGAPPAGSSTSKQDQQHVSAYASDGKDGKKKDERSLGRKMKDKLTGTTHEERVQQRKKRQEEEMKQYQAYLVRRKQILEAQRQGRYQPMYAAPASPYSRPMYYNSGIGMPYGYGGYGYGRRGMGMGMGPGMAVGGGLLGGLLLGDMLF